MLNAVRFQMMNKKFAGVVHAAQSVPCTYSCPMSRGQMGACLLSHCAVACRTGEEHLRKSGAAYCIVRPGRFVDKPAGAAAKLKTGVLAP